MLMNKNTRISIHIPISPNKAFYSRLTWLRKSLDSLGAPYSDALLHITISNEEHVTHESVEHEFYDYIRNKERYRLHITDSSRFAAYSYGETAGLRFKNIDDSDITIFCDADILFIDRIDDLIDTALMEGGIYGVIAHISPFKGIKTSPQEMWNHLSKRYLNETIELSYKHSHMPHIPCPAYYNYGMIIGRTETWNKFKDFAYENFSEIIELTTQDTLFKSETYRAFSMQLSLTLSLHKFNIHTKPISDIYNCANDEKTASLLGQMIDHVRIIHYLRNTFFNRDSIFTSHDEINAFLNLEHIDPVSKILQDKVKNVLNDLDKSTYPFTNSI